MEVEFQGKVALVTGGGRGIGRALCLRLAEGGAAIALNYRSDDAAARETQTLLEERGGRCALVKADVGDELDFRAAVDKARAKLGPIGLMLRSMARSSDAASKP
jgi:3-oxoacyl-[acyl-carrier protein] reductase